MESVISKDGTSIAFDRFGNGPALILVGGATVIRAYQTAFATVLGDHFTVYSYDRRGRGESGDTLPYAVAREIEDLEAMIDAAGGSAFVFGHSSGAVLSLRAAAAGLAISKLAVYGPPFIVDDSRVPGPADYVEHLDELVAAGRRGDAFAYFMTAGVGVPEEIVAQMRQGPGWGASEAVAHTIAYDGRVMGDTTAGKPLADEPWNSINVPTLVLDGGESPAWMHAGAEALMSKLPHGELRTLAGQDQGPADDVLAPVLMTFFAG